jgi:hypothetical protein
VPQPKLATAIDCYFWRKPSRPKQPQHKSRGCVKRLTRLSEIGKLLVALFPTVAREGGAMEGAMPIINFRSGRLLRVELDDRHPNGGLK